MALPALALARAVPRPPWWAAVGLAAVILVGGWARDAWYADERASIGVGAVPALVKGLDAADDEARRAAAMTLGHIGPPAKDALPRLETVAEEDGSRRVREVAEIAVRRIKARK